MIEGIRGRLDATCNLSFEWNAIDPGLHEAAFMNIGGARKATVPPGSSRLKKGLKTVGLRFVITDFEDCENFCRLPLPAIVVDVQL